MGLFEGKTKGVRHFKDRSRLSGRGEEQVPDKRRPWTRVFENPRKVMRQKVREEDNRIKRPHKNRRTWRQHVVGD